MFISDKLVYVELHKTGGTHIGRLLNCVIGGVQVGKHNRIPVELRDHFVIGSVRNPWDWYVSLWAYGCGGDGSVRRQSTRRYDASYYWDGLPSEMGKTSLAAREFLTQCWADSLKPVAQWREVYADSRAPHLFRRWLKLMLSPKRRWDVGEGYGFSPLSARFGLLTYRYMKLFCALDGDLYKDRSISTFEGLSTRFEHACFVDHIIRNEFLEDDLLQAFKMAGIGLSSAQEDVVRSAASRRTNASRRHAAGHYYDAETAALVAQKEAFIIDRHSYSPPF